MEGVLRPFNVHARSSQISSRAKKRNPGGDQRGLGEMRDPRGVGWVGGQKV